MRKFLFAIAALLSVSSTALAHPGHTEIVDGHRHTFLDLVMMGAAPVAVALAIFAAILILRGRKS